MEKKKRVFVKAKEEEETPGEKPVTVSADVVRIRLVEPLACGYVSRVVNAHLSNMQAENLKRLRVTLGELPDKPEEGNNTGTNAHALRWLLAKVRPGVTIKFE
jgi:glycerol-3-phosphate cytidylyltransferase-like family protein